MIINAFEMASVGYYAQGTWSHPESQRHRYVDLDFWLERSKLLEEAGFDALFFADVLGVYDVYRSSQAPAIAGAVDFPLNDPFLLVSAMLTNTRQLAFVLTASTTYESPFALARRLATLDHLSKGRVGWNIVTSYLPNAARNHGLAEQMPHEQRYQRAEEFLAVVYQLLEHSWDDDAVVYDKAGKVYADPDKVHTIDHRGEFFSVQGPALTQPSVQRTPVLYQAGASTRGLQFAATHAEVVFVNGSNRAALTSQTAKLRAAAVAAGRAPDDVKLVTDLSIVLGHSRIDAQANANEVRRAQSAEAQYAAFGGASGFDLSRFGDRELLPATLTQFSQAEAARFTTEQDRPDTIADIKTRLLDLSPYARTLVGTADDVATEMEAIIKQTGIDGFNLHEFVTPRDFEQFSEQVMPLLISRGLRRAPTGFSSHRHRLFGNGDRLADTHPAAAVR